MDIDLITKQILKELYAIKAKIQKSDHDCVKEEGAYWSWEQNHHNNFLNSLRNIL